MTYSERLYVEKKKGHVEGFREGEAKGRAEGEAKGRAEGEARGRIAAIIVGVRNMVNKMKISVNEAMDIFNVSPADRPVILAAPLVRSAEAAGHDRPAGGQTRQEQRMEQRLKAQVIENDGNPPSL